MYVCVIPACLGLGCCLCAEYGSIAVDWKRREDESLKKEKNRILRIGLQCL